MSRPATARPPGSRARLLGSARARLALAMIVSLAVLTGSTSTALRDVSAADQIVELPPQAMTYINDAAPSAVYSGSSDLVVASEHYATYLRFDTSGIASTSTIVSAELTVRVSTSTAVGPGLAVVKVAPSGADPSMSYTTMSYQSRPTVVSGALNPDEATTPSAGKTVAIALTGLANTEPESFLALRVSYPAPNATIHLSKSTAPVLRLVVSSASGSKTGSDPATRPDVLPYAAAGLNSSTKKVFAHYFPPYPISLDNDPPATDYYARNYLSPDGEDGKFRAVGGLLRDRPEGRAPIAGDAKLADAATEVRQAAAAGIDGFTVNILGWSGEIWNAALRIAKAAGRSGTGFVAVPNIDMSSDAANASEATIAARLATYYATPGAYRMADGRFLLSVFYAEARPPSYYQSLIAELKNRYGLDIAWSGIFNSLSDDQIAEYAPVSYSLGTWGVRSASQTLSFPNRAAAVHQYGVKWVAPIAVQDVRHRTLSYAESGNTDLLRASWSKAISGGADYAQLVTWNDYSESTSFAPSVSHRSAFLDLNGYYLTQFKQGSATTLTGDELIVTHRIQQTTTQPRRQTASMDYTLSGSETVPRDTVEVLCMCRSAATVTLNVGGDHISYHARAGVSFRTMPLATGPISARAVRNGVTVATATSPFPVVDSIDYWNLQYYAVSSRQNP